MPFQKLFGLFEYEPFATTLLFLLITITVLAIVVGASIGGYDLFRWMKKRREEQLREAAFARRAEAV